MAAQIQFQQGASNPPGGQALQGVTGVLVTASDSGGDVVATYTWTLVSVPPGSAVVVGSLGAAATATFTPDVVGGYLVQLTTLDNLGHTTTDVRAVLIPEDAVYSRILPPWNAPGTALNIGGQTRGWAPFMEAYLYVIDRLRDVASTLPTAGQVLSWNDVAKQWAPTTLSLAGSGDWSGPVSSNSVDKIKGAALPATTPVGGDIYKLLQVSGAATLNYALLVNANVDAAAAIAGSKISPNFGAQNIIGQNLQVTALSKGAVGVDVSGNLLIETALPLPVELSLVSGIEYVTVSSFTRVGSRIIDLTAYPTTLSDGRTLVAKLVMDIETTAGTVYAQLFNMTDNETVTNTTFNTTSIQNTEFTGTLTVGAAAGNLKTGKLYEMQINITGGASFDRATCTNARIVLTYA